MAYAEDSDFGDYLKQINTTDAARADAIKAAASMMDLDFDSAGITTTPIDTSVVENATKKDELDSLLKLINIRWAARILTTGSSGTGKKVVKDAAEMDDLMKKIVSGAKELPVPYTRDRTLVRR